MTIQRKKRKLIILTVLLLIFSVLLFKPVANSVGFCFAEKRFLSDEELITKVVDDTYAVPPRYYTIGGKLVLNPIKYKNREDFLNLNPDCCKIVSETDDGFQPAWFQSFRGKNAAMVEIKYRVEWKPPNGGSSPGMPEGVVRGYVTVGNCGYVWNGF